MWVYRLSGDELPLGGRQARPFAPHGGWTAVLNRARELHTARDHSSAA